MRVCKRGRGGSPRSAPIAVAKPRLVFPGAPGKEEEMTGLLKKLIADEAAQDMAEYGIALAVVGLVAALAALAIATNVGSLWSRANNIISQANP